MQCSWPSTVPWTESHSLVGAKLQVPCRDTLYYDDQYHHHYYILHVTDPEIEPDYGDMEFLNDSQAWAWLYRNGYVKSA